ncbi:MULTISPECIES: family 43 glycosylhydrolase [unclassified Saccharicrinis]|uniref:family 43 glycosylhydrolase n=1 Tax=unclassified Saccharicrinis TaxID=2646859 RepID=UPI003D33FEE9
MRPLNLSVLLIVILSTHGLFAQNPIKKDFGMADPHCYIFNNKAYLFTTRDASNTSNKFNMPDWQIWSSDDLTDWKLERYIYPKETYMGESDRCWATETASMNGKYYFYFSNGNTNTGVMVADKPEGPYKDALGKPLLDVELTSTQEYDPTVLVDEDNKAYIVFGHYRKDTQALAWYIARLNEDMISLAEQPKEIVVENAFDIMTANDKPNLHKRNGIYYLSAGSHYATSKNVYGPYKVIGNSGNGKYGLHSRAHGNYFTWNNQWFHTWCHFHLGKDIARYRESYMTYLHYTDDGRMVSDVAYLDAHFETGVGQYDASWDCIQAEWYMKANGAAKRECLTGGFELQNIQHGATLIYPNMANIQSQKSVKFHLASSVGGVIEVRSGHANGKLLGKAIVKPTGGNDKYTYVSCNLVDAKEVEDICFHFVGKGDDLMRLDYFVFEK